MNDRIITITLPPEAKNENLRFDHISFFDDDDMHGIIFLQGNIGLQIITQRAYFF